MQNEKNIQIVMKTKIKIKNESMIIDRMIQIFSRAGRYIHLLRLYRIIIKLVYWV